MRDFPMTMDDLTPEWLTERMAGAAGCTVTDAHVQPFGAQGLLSQLAQADMAWSCGSSHGEPTRVIAKLPSQFESVRALASKRDWYRNEARFYRDFGTDPGIATAWPYLAEAGERRDEAALLMEDLSPAVPVRMGTRNDELYRQAVEALARFHAKWWQSEAVLGSDWLSGVDMQRDEELLKLDEEELHAAALSNRERIGSDYPEYLLDAAKATAAHRRNIRQRYETRPLTLLHGDYFERQFFVASEAGGGFAVCDWQMVSAGPGAEDLSRFLAIAYDIEGRRRVEPEMIALYRDVLMANGVRDYSSDDLREDYRWGLSRAVGVQTLGLAALSEEQFERARQQAAAQGLPGPFNQNTAALASCLEDHGYLSLFA